MSKRPKYYPVADHVSYEERKSLGLPPEATATQRVAANRLIHAKRANDYRLVLPGEWYLSGAIPAAYKYPNTAMTPTTTPYHIMKLCLVQTEQIEITYEVTYDQETGRYVQVGRAV